ncbi:class I SAM-dependent methyltransferase [Flavimaricola marinus]|uniref:Macrocin-O-methyltransferase (TylF) n=1 Tax=Flavimaricola marinus TaxID=1819565 RepID=A0A238LHI7_9RHOB|nr:class I SAM-dependent methyltransferase [Flavimaricola marinus]SMY09098.1 Macrocin-O-methyltransferase (TylF) [Flavimaricola marinus]
MAQTKLKEKPQDNSTKSAKKPRGKKKQIKSMNRARFLQKMPKGGVAIEIGVWRGEFSRKILDALEPKKLCLIDPWKSFEDHDDAAFSGREEAEKMDEIFADVSRMYEAEIKSKQVIMMREMSLDALKKFKDETINFAYVDGDHSYEGVKADLEALMPKMVSGGIMAFDDYHRRGWWGDGVLRAIHEFIGAHPSEIRIMTVIGAQIALEKITPLDEKPLS